MSSRVGPSGPPGPDRMLYPMFVDLEGRRCAVIGGGGIAEGRVRALIEHGAVVRLVSPQITSELARMVAEGAIVDHRERTYRPEDLEGCFLVIAATDREQVNRMVRQDAEARNVICNVVDAPSLCDFIVPSLVRRGELSLAVTTGGASPVVAKHIRRQLGTMYGPEWGALIALLREMRGELKERHPDMPGRREAVERLMRTDVVRLLAEGDEQGARDLARREMGLGVHA